VKLFRLHILNSIGILVPTGEGMGPPCCNGYIECVATGVLICYVVRLVLAHFV
jgi:hypothetical protein